MSDDYKPLPGTPVYRASQVFGYGTKRLEFWIDCGTVSLCGEWVCVGEVRHPLTAAWHKHRVDAEASIADSIEETARSYIAQAQRLRDAARQEVAT